MTRALVVTILAFLLLYLLAHALHEQPEPPVEVRVEDIRSSWTPTVPASTTTTTTLPTTTTTHVRIVEPQTVARSAPTGNVPDAIRRGFSRFGAAVAEEAVRVASCETGGTFNPAARNGRHRGLFQISETYHDARVRRLGFTWAQMDEAGPNITVAADLYAEQGWRPWTCRRAA